MDSSNLRERPNSNMFAVQNVHDREGEYLFPQVRIPPDYMPNGRKSLCGISIHAFGLGTSLGLCLVLTVQLAYWGHYLWRIPFFISTLSVFHYLEFDMTARYNPPDAKVSSFLLFTNGRAYNIAHTSAILETLIRFWLTTRLNLAIPLIPQSWQTALHAIPFPPSVVLGSTLIVLGQGFRSLAMKQAGTSFNHIVQSNKKEDHVLITSGLYSISRHPAYFGFFWWGLGTQLVLGNIFCFVAYTAVLWRFFAHRIKHEERHLVNFFGDAYRNYRRNTPVLIPFI